MSDFKIEKHIEPPKPTMAGNRKYPFHLMEVGDSFKFPRDKRNSISGAAVVYAQKTNKRFQTKRIDTKTCRIWRVK